ncbi:MAG: biotin transporter BioY [Sedimentisphaerales bacterium]|nr:biotin transporter BioY [Sedimentisphaerales bacterium]
MVNQTIAGVLRPGGEKLAMAYDIALIVAGSVFIAASAQVAVILPISPVPVTGQTFAVLMVGMLFGARRGSLCILAYLTQGLAGLPVFSLGKAGPAVLLGPTGGYLVGFVAAAYITGLLAEQRWDRHIPTTILTMALGNITIYAFGLAWLCVLAGLNNALTTGLYPFIAGDTVKIALAAILLPGTWKILTSAGLLKDGREHTKGQ